MKNTFKEQLEQGKELANKIRNAFEEGKEENLVNLLKDFHRKQGSGESFDKFGQGLKDLIEPFND